MWMLRKALVFAIIVGNILLVGLILTIITSLCLSDKHILGSILIGLILAAAFLAPLLWLIFFPVIVSIRAKLPLPGIDLGQTRFKKGLRHLVQDHLATYLTILLIVPVTISGLVIVIPMEMHYVPEFLANPNAYRVAITISNVLRSYRIVPWHILVVVVSLVIGQYVCSSGVLRLTDVGFPISRDRRVKGTVTKILGAFYLVVGLVFGTLGFLLPAYALFFAASGIFDRVLGLF